MCCGDSSSLLELEEFVASERAAGRLPASVDLEMDAAEFTRLLNAEKGLVVVHPVTDAVLMSPPRSCPHCAHRSPIKVGAARAVCGKCGTVSAVAWVSPIMDGTEAAAAASRSWR